MDELDAFVVADHRAVSILDAVAFAFEVVLHANVAVLAALCEVVGGDRLVFVSGVGVGESAGAQEGSEEDGGELHRGLGIREALLR